MDPSPKPPFPDRFETELKLCFRLIQSLDLGMTRDGRFTRHGAPQHPNQLVTTLLREYVAHKGHFRGAVARRLVNHALQRTHTAAIEAMRLATSKVEGEVPCQSP